MSRNRRYKIGEIGKLFDIPNDTLRYYETRGIITPHRDEESGYRYYDAWDVNFILDSIWYRGYDFALSDVEKMVNEDSLEGVHDKLKRREFEILEEIQELRRKLDYLAAWEKKVAQAKSVLGRFTETNSPAMLWQRNRLKGEYAAGEDAESIRTWTKLMPYVSHTFVLPPRPDNGEEEGYLDYSWGFALSPEEATRFGVKPADTVEYIPSYPSVYTVFYAEGDGTFLECMREQVIKPIKAMGYRITSHPVGNIIARVHEDGGMKRYFEIWVPAEKM